MVLVIDFLGRSLRDFYTKHEDPRSIDFLFMESPPLKFAAIMMAYVLLITLGPKVMRHRKPLELKWPMRVNNVFQILVNGYYGLFGLYFFFIQNDYNFECPAVLVGTDDYAFTALHIAHVYFLSKLWDLIDTVFIVLKKKERQLSFLHCYHHIIMALASFFFLKFIQDTTFATLGVINAMVHSCMYFYYLLSSFRSEVKQSIRWKKHITHIQMIQFSLLVFHFLRELFNTECHKTKLVPIFAALQNLAMLYMFGKFYINNYLLKKDIRKKE